MIQKLSSPLTVATSKSNASAAPPVQLQQRKQTWETKVLTNNFQMHEDQLDKTSPKAKLQISEEYDKKKKIINKKKNWGAADDEQSQENTSKETTVSKGDENSITSSKSFNTTPKLDQLMQHQSWTNECSKDEKENLLDDLQCWKVQIW